MLLLYFLFLSLFLLITDLLISYPFPASLSQFRHLPNFLFYSLFPYYLHYLHYFFILAIYDISLLSHFYLLSYTLLCYPFPSLLYTFISLLSSLIPPSSFYLLLSSLFSYPFPSSSYLFLTSLLPYPVLFSSLLFFSFFSSIAQRKDLKVILMSATLNAELFSNYFKNEGKIKCAIVTNKILQKCILSILFFCTFCIKNFPY